MLNIKDAFDGFNIGLTIDEDGDWQAILVELPEVSAFAASADEALQELADAWDAMKASYRKRDEKVPVAPARKEYSGQFNVRLDRRVHCALAIEAAQAGISLNALIAQTLSTHVKLHSNH